MNNFKLVDSSVQDQIDFKKGVEELCDKLSLSFSIMINKVSLNVKNEDGTSKNVFVDEPMLLLQKKVAIPDTSEPETPKVVNVEATPTVSPFVPQAPTNNEEN
jgi:hypothetical protein